MAKSAIFALVFVVGALVLLQNQTNAFTSTTNTPSAQVESYIVQLFAQWTHKHGKVYASNDEKIYRILVFRENVLKIQKHNSLKKSYSLAINQFADLTAEEFKAKYVSLKKPSTSHVLNLSYLNTDNVPESVDWRQQGVVGPVYDQSQCGSCWAFSAVAALESLNAKSTGVFTRLSEQELVDCSGPQGNEGCHGGLIDYAFEYVKENGIETEAQYPYKGRDQKCNAQKGAAFFRINGYVDVPPNDNSQLEAAVAQGVVSVAIEADTEVFQFYESGIIDDEACGTELDHGVAVVGYGVEKGRSFWIVKNSWGGSWGDKGYVKILKDNGPSEGVCGIALAASYPTL